MQAHKKIVLISSLNIMSLYFSHCLRNTEPKKHIFVKSIKTSSVKKTIVFSIFLVSSVELQSI